MTLVFEKGSRGAAGAKFLAEALRALALEFERTVRVRCAAVAKRSPEAAAGVQAARARLNQHVDAADDVGAPATVA